MPELPNQLRDHEPNHLRRALELAESAAAFASPNPTVGCVLASPQGELLGEGAHHYDRRDHAEIVALKAAAAAGRSVRGATAFVTLEPCSTTGRTGPCADALITAEIARCLILTADPNPAVHGNGIARMRAAGVDVTLLDPANPLAQQARRLNDAFAFSITHSRPFVTLKSALSVDGKLAPLPDQRTAPAQPFWLTGDAARADVQCFRHQHDAILTGIGTVLADDPSLTDRTGLARRHPLLRIVLDRNLRTPLDAKLVASADSDLLICCDANASADQAAALTARGAEIHRLPPTNALPALLSSLQGRPIRSLLLEAGPSLNEAFLRAHLVDKLVFYIAETELGTQAVPFAHTVHPQLLQQQMTSPSRRAFPHGTAEDIRLTGYLHDPWAAAP